MKWEKPTNQTGKKTIARKQEKKEQRLHVHTQRKQAEQGMNQPVPLHSCPASHGPAALVNWAFSRGFRTDGSCLLASIYKLYIHFCHWWPFRKPNNQIQFKSKIHSFGGWGTAKGRKVCSEHKAVVCSKHHRNPNTFTSTWKHSPHQLRSYWQPIPA